LFNKSDTDFAGEDTIEQDERQSFLGFCNGVEAAVEASKPMFTWDKASVEDAAQLRLTFE
jgi:hypothetical protein